MSEALRKSLKSETSDFRLQTLTSTLLRRRPATRGPRAAGVDIVPVQDGGEAEGVRALRQPAPERTNREHHDVAFAERMIDRGGGARHRLAPGERAGEQQIVRVR